MPDLKLHYTSVCASNYKSLGRFGVFFWFYFSHCICTTDLLQNITNFGADIILFLHGLQHVENTVGQGLLFKATLTIFASMHLNLCQSQ